MHPVNRTLSTFAFIVIASALPAAAAGAQQQTMSVCHDGTTSSVTGRGACTAHGGVDTKATAKAMKLVTKQQKAEVKGAARTGASVTCGDGTSSAAGRGACSHHGGVKTAAGASMTAPAPSAASPAAPMPAPSAAPATNASPRASARAADRAAASSAVVGSGAREDNNPAGAVAKCKDGMYSHARSHQGACGHHGGVAQWMGA